jgi:hypothetical protein
MRRMELAHLRLYHIDNDLDQAWLHRRDRQRPPLPTDPRTDVIQL